MSDVLARAAEVLGAHGCSSVSWVDSDAICATCDRIVGHSDDDLLDEIAIENTHQAQMLADAGLLADEPPAPNLTVLLDNATPEQAEAIFGAAMDAAFDAAPDGVVVGGAATLAEPAPVAGGNGAVAAEQSPPRPTTHETLDSLTARLVAARAATDGYRTEAERLRELLDEANAKIERMEEL